MVRVTKEVGSPVRNSQNALRKASVSWMASARAGAAVARKAAADRDAAGTAATALSTNARAVWTGEAEARTVTAEPRRATDAARAGARDDGATARSGEEGREGESNASVSESKGRSGVARRSEAIARSSRGQPRLATRRRDDASRQAPTSRKHRGEGNARVEGEDGHGRHVGWFGSDSEARSATRAARRRGDGAPRGEISRLRQNLGISHPAKCRDCSVTGFFRDDRQLARDPTAFVNPRR